MDEAGNTYITGSFQSASVTFGSVTLNNTDPSGSPDIYIAKLNPQGVVLWARKAGSTSDDVATGIGVDSSGNAYITGYCSGIANFGGINLTNASFIGNVFVVKYDGAGNVIWARSASSANDASANSIAVAANGTSYVSGYFNGAMTFGAFSLAGSGFKDIFVARLDSSGNVVWLKSAGGGVDDEAKGIGIDANGNCYVTGYFISTSAQFGAITLTNNISSAEVFVAKYTSTGTVSWVRQGKGNILEFGYAIAADASGNSYVAGAFWDTFQLGNTTLTNTGSGGDIFVAKYDTSGNLLWAKQAGGDDDDAATGITVDQAGFTYLTGYFTSTSATFAGTTLTNSGEFTGDVFVTKIDPAGNLLWSKSAGSIDDERGNGIAVDKDGNGFVSGYFNASATFDGVTVTNINTSDVFVAKFDTAPFVYKMTRISPTQMSFTYPYLPVTAGMESIPTLGTSIWQPVTNADILIGEQRTVTVSTTNGSRFFRLNKSLPE